MSSDVFPTLFGALRDRLAVHVSSSGSATRAANVSVLTGLHQVPSNALLTSLSTSDTNVRESIIQEIRHDAKLQLLRRKRLAVRKVREAKRRQKQQMDALVTKECDVVMQEASTHDQKFQYFMIETHSKATARLQMLFSECIAEMKKALDRVQSVAADATEESESMVKDLLRGYKWQLFLTRLQQDCGGDVKTSLLVPSGPHDECNNKPPVSATPMNDNESVKAVLKRAIQGQGPTLANRKYLVIRSVMALCRTRSIRRASDKDTPYLHFGASAAEMLAEAVGNMTGPQRHTKPRRSSSARRIRQLPPSKGATTAFSESTPVFSTDGGMCSSFRQLPTGTPQFPKSACDVPLSSLCIRWMITSQYDSGCSSNDASGSGWWSYREVVDSNIYFDIAEYEQNFAAIMQNYATSAAMDDISTTDHTVMASARRCLREINAILERSREQKEAYSADTIFAIPHRFNRTKDTDKDCSVFARASVLQLVQTLYYSKCFLALLPPADVDTLRNLYPTILFGEGCLSTLYVPVFDGTNAREVLGEEETTLSVTSPSIFSMLPLNDHAIHELLLTYVARGRRALIQDPGSMPQLASLALSDALSTLVPCYQMDSNQRTDTPFCVIKNPWGLWRHDTDADDQPYSNELQRLRDADIVFVECADTNLRDLGPEQQSVRVRHTKTSTVLNMLGASCTWRSCTIFRESHELQSSSNLCLWHTFVQNFLEAEESKQYIPNASHMKEVFLTAGNESAAETTKRIIQTSSSLLEELLSRHLPQSINAFYEHVVSVASNRAYQAGILDAGRLGGPTNGNMSISELEHARHELQRLIKVSEEIADTENCVTRELRQLLQLTVYPGVTDSFVQHGLFDLEELQSDIRTRDLELLLRLSQQKLQILERRRKEEEEQVIRTLAPSSSLPSMNVYSALDHVGLDDLELGSSSVYDVIHVKRKGRQSLLRQQLDGKMRNRSKQNNLPAYSLERCASDLANRISPYETKVAPTAKYRANGHVNGKRTVRKNSRR